MTVVIPTGITSSKKNYSVLFLAFIFRGRCQYGLLHFEHTTGIRSGSLSALSGIHAWLQRRHVHFGTVTYSIHAVCGSFDMAVYTRYSYILYVVRDYIGRLIYLSVLHMIQPKRDRSKQEMTTPIIEARKEAEKAIAKYAAALHNAGYNALCIRQSVNGLGFDCAYIIPDSWDDQ